MGSNTESDHRQHGVVNTGQSSDSIVTSEATSAVQTHDQSARLRNPSGREQDVEAAHPDNMKTDDDHEPHHKVSFAERSLRITWAWFPVNMSTGAMASLIAQQPFTFTGLMTIGKIFYIVNLVFYCLFLSLIIARFVRKPRAFYTSLHHPSEGFFFGGFWVATALVINGMQVYGVPACGPWLVTAMRVVFWIYYACAVLVAVLQYHVIFQDEKLSPSDAMPAWILPAYPFLVTGTLAAAIAKTQPPDRAIEIIIGGLAGQGLGWILAFMVYTVYLNRLIYSYMPEPSVRPGMFVSVGPTGYTCAGLISLGQQAMVHIPADFIGDLSIPVGELWYGISVPIAIFLWLTAIWFSALSTVSVIRGSRQMSFSLQWWAFVFPNAGLAIGTIQIGTALSSNPINIAATIITIALVPLWFLCAIMHIRAVWMKELLYPGKDIGVDDVNMSHDKNKVISQEKKAMKKQHRQGRDGPDAEKGH